MGMTYAGYIIPKDSVDFKKHWNDGCIDYLIDNIRGVGEYILDEDTFDREALGRWLGLTNEQRNNTYNHGYCFITIDQIQNAIKTLKDLDERVSNMRFVMVEKEDVVGMHWEPENKEGERWTWRGPEENEAIYREVMKVFNKDYHYIFPWDTRFKGLADKWWGCSGYIKELEDALEKVEDAMTSPDYPNGCEIVLFYY